jgi:hypothetical protein
MGTTPSSAVKLFGTEEPVPGSPILKGGVEVTAELPADTVERPGTEPRLLVDTGRAILIHPQSERLV